MNQENPIRFPAADIVGKENLSKDEIVQHLVEVELLRHDENNNMFLRLIETLRRIGIGSRDATKANTLYQTAHILHKRGRYYIVHFKHLFMIDGRGGNNLTMGDIARLNRIVTLLEEWGMVRVVDPNQHAAPRCSLSNIHVIKHADAANWNLRAKYDMETNQKQKETQAA